MALRVIRVYMADSNEAIFFLADMSTTYLLVSNREVIKLRVSQGVKPLNSRIAQERIKSIDRKISE